MYYLTRHRSSICPMNISLQCDLTNQISNCQQMEGEIQINIPRNICPKEIHKNSSNNSRSNFVFVIPCLFLVGLVCLMFLKISSRRRSH